MDPLSLTASIIAILDISGKIIGFCSTYISAIKHAPSDLRIIRAEIEALQAITRLLDLPSSTLIGQQNAALESLRGSGGALKSCQQCLERLLALLQGGKPEEARSSSRLKLRRLLNLRLKAVATNVKDTRDGQDVTGSEFDYTSWPRKQATAHALLEEISKYKATITLALAVDARHSTAGIASEVHTVYQEKRNASEAEVRRNFLTWLNAPLGELWHKHSTVTALRCPTTCLWMFDLPEFQDWRKQGALLWLNGTVGCGKTTIISAIIQQMQLEVGRESEIVAFFYFDRSHLGLTSVQDCIAALITQVLGDATPTLDEVQSWVGKEGLTMMESSQTASVLLTEKALFRMLAGKSATFIIDAIDDSDDNRKVLALIKGLSQFDGVKVIFTSRPDVTIRRRWNKIAKSLGSTSARPAAEVTVTARLTASDIRTYITEATSQLIESGDLELHDPTLRFDIIETLERDSHGMFQWVAFHLRNLGTFFTDAEIRRALTRLPDGLDNTYQKIMEGIQQRPSHQRELAHRVLQWVAFAARPLTLAELCVAVSIVVHSQELKVSEVINNPLNLLAVCDSLLIYSHETNTVTFAHHTIRDYLLTHYSESGEFELQFHTILAKLCLAYLQFTSVRQALEHMQYGDLGLGELHEGTLAFVHYAAKFWMVHAQKGRKEDERLSSIADSFFFGLQGSFPSWQEIYEPPKWDASMERRRLQHSARYVTSEEAQGISAPSPFHSPPFSLALRGFPRNLPFASLKSVGSASSFGVYLPIGQHESLFSSKSLRYQPLHYIARIGFSRCVPGIITNETGGPLSTTPLHEAARFGQTEVFKALLAADRLAEISIDKQDRLGRTALFYASRNGSLEIAKVLIERGASIDLEDWAGHTALDEAKREWHEKIIRLIKTSESTPEKELTAGGLEADFRKREGSIADQRRLSTATTVTTYSSSLLTSGLRLQSILPQPDQDDLELQAYIKAFADGYYHPAPTLNSLELLEELIHNGMSINRVGDHHRTLLHHLCAKPLTRLVLNALEWIINHGADSGMRDSEGQTCLRHLLANSSLFDPKLLDDTANTAETGDLQMGRVISAFLRGHDLHDATNASGQAPLLLHTLISGFFDSDSPELGQSQGSWAKDLARKRFIDIISSLKEAGASLHTVDELGQTPFSLAVECYATNHRESPGSGQLLVDIVDLLSTSDRSIHHLSPNLGTDIINSLVSTAPANPGDRRGVYRCLSRLNLSASQTATALGNITEAEGINTLIASGVNPNAQDRYGNTALHIQARNWGKTSEDQRPAVRLLREAGAEPGLRNYAGAAPAQFLTHIRSPADADMFRLLGGEREELGPAVMKLSRAAPQAQGSWGAGEDVGKYW
ncbi:hypothetical protein F4778DRAFT_63806 [Xylariomycetidae sp. FL2044]|nr:hypothetical protein F4778DRAFT_63806 [Xylariomycetidae sp. FL2044]